MLQAYCRKRSYAGGDLVELCVSTDAKWFGVEVIRDGIEPKTVYRAGDIAGEYYPVPGDAVENGCGWPVALSFPVGDDWRSGFHKIQLTSSNDETAEAFLIVRAKAPQAAILWVIETNTWNAYNFFGGASTYTADGTAYAAGAARVSFQRPLPPGFISLPRDAHRLATVKEVDTSLPYGKWAAEQGLTLWTGAASWGQWGQAFTRWLEKEGIAVDYAASSDLQDYPDLLSRYRLMLSVGHDEYWTWEMRDTVETFIAKGGNAAFLSGNTAYWQVRIERNGEQMVAYKAAVDADPVIGTPDERHNSGIWSHALTRRPENEMTGLSFTRGGYARLAGATPASAGGYTIYRADHWALAGTGLSYGDQLGADLSLVGYECDGCALTLRDGLPFPTGEDGTPPNFEIIGIAPVALWTRQTAPEGLYPEGSLSDLELVCQQVAGNRDEATLQRFAHGHAVMGCYTRQGGGTVFSGGTTDWTYALADPQVAQITRNIVAKLSAVEAG